MAGGPGKGGRGVNGLPSPDSGYIHVHDRKKSKKCITLSDSTYVPDFVNAKPQVYRPKLLILS